MTMTEEAPVMAASAAPGSETSVPADGGKKGKKAKKDKGPKGRSNLLPALVLGAGVAAGGYFMGGGGASASSTETTVVMVAPEPGEMVRLDAMTLNLAEGRFLRIGVALQMTMDFEPVEGGEGELKFSPADEGRLRDLVIAMFSGRDADQLTDIDQRDAMKDELLNRANVLFDDQVMMVYFTELVMQ